MNKPQQPPQKPREQERATGWVVETRPDGEIVVIQAVTAYESDSEARVLKPTFFKQTQTN